LGFLQEKHKQAKADKTKLVTTIWLHIYGKRGLPLLSLTS